MTKKLQNDCFALPPGINWTPVREALDALKTRMTAVTGIEELAIEDAAGRILAANVSAVRSHPPFANSAVDGYGFDASCLTAETTSLPILKGRAAAGSPFEGTVPFGHAVRVLTGAAIPDGVTSVALDEDVQVEGDTLIVDGALKPGANCRAAGEDMTAGQVILHQGRRLSAGDIASAISTGVSHASVRKRLRVAVLSTGDEVVQPGTAAGDGQIFDANRPMLASVLEAWGYDVVNVGHVRDDAASVRAALNEAAANADAILTTGGASAGDEDHVSTALRDGDSLHMWRIAIKPGRPLAMAMWNGVPVFGLPGNPVAAFVCTLVFARPSLSVLAGGEWSEPDGYVLPAAFSKNKKPGRMEYLRARYENGSVSVFASEGSGRVSGLSWATGLVEIGHEAQTITPGMPVTYIPFSNFGLPE